MSFAFVTFYRSTNRSVARNPIRTVKLSRRERIQLKSNSVVGTVHCSPCANEIEIFFVCSVDVVVVLAAIVGLHFKCIKLITAIYLIEDCFVYLVLLVNRHHHVVYLTITINFDINRLSLSQSH